MKCLFCGLLPSIRRVATIRRGQETVVSGDSERALLAGAVRALHRLPFGAEENLGDSLYARKSDAQEVVIRDVDL